MPLLKLELFTCHRRIDDALNSMRRIVLVPKAGARTTRVCVLRVVVLAKGVEGEVSQFPLISQAAALLRYRWG